MDDDQRLRAAVLAELAEDAPPPSGGGLPEVVRLGRRRRRARYAGAALAVAALLTATGAAAVTLSGDPLPPAAPSPRVDAVPELSDWPMADLEGQIPYDTFQPGDVSGSPSAPHVQVLPYPLCEYPDQLHERTNVYPAADDQLAAFVQAVRAAAPTARVASPIVRHLEATRPGQHDSYFYSADITDSGGTGSVTLEAGDFTGTPLEVADAQAFDLANCAPPKRHVLGDGTVLQVYELRPAEPFQSLSRALRIFRPDGRMLQVTVASWGSPDFAPDPAQPGMPVRTGPGRPTLPLTEGQLAEVGLAIAR